MEAGLSVFVLVATEAVEDQEERLDAEATSLFDLKSTSEKFAELPEVVLGVDSSSSSSMSGSWFGGLGRDICLGGRGGGFRNPLVAVVEVVDGGVLVVILVLAVIIDVDSEEATQVLGTSEGHLQLLE